MADTERRREVRTLLVGEAGAALRGVELLLVAHGVRVNATAGDAPAAARALGANGVNLVLLDLGLLDEARRVVDLVRQEAPRLPIMGFGDRRPWPIVELLDAGMRGFALTVATPAAFLQAIQVVAGGASYLDPDFAVADRGDADRHDRTCLTERERQILGLLAHGLTGREAASRLFLSPATVRTHVQNAMHKLGARTRAQAIAMVTGGAETVGAASG